MKNGISIVALIITIIVLIVLTAAVVITGSNTPENTQLAVFYNNISTVQEAVTLKILNNQSKYIANVENMNNFKWIGVIQGYKEEDAALGMPDFENDVRGINIPGLEGKVLPIDTSIIKSVNIPEDTVSDYYISEKGVIYNRLGKQVGNYVYYNRNAKVLVENVVNDGIGPNISINVNEENNTFIVNIVLFDEDGIDYTKSKYVLTKSNNNLGSNILDYTDGVLTSTNQELELGLCGTYYMHVIATDLLGNVTTKVSNAFEGMNIEYGTIGEVNDYVYKGNYETVIIPFDGIYKLEVWGAQGGNAIAQGVLESEYVGLGGYSSGLKKFNKDEEVFIYVGGKGQDAILNANVTGGWNGGGDATCDGNDDESSGGGGGATDMRTIDGEWNNQASLLSRIIVAGGSGGSSYRYMSGAGGGEIGGITEFTDVTPATQNDGYALGQGQHGYGIGDSDGVGGGGGGYFGGRTKDTGAKTAGAGGSGYIGGVINGITISGINAGSGKARITQYIDGYSYLHSI